MRAYFQLFFGLLIPLSALFIAADIVYFQKDYGFAQAVRLGVLSGFLIAMTISIFIAFILLVIRHIKVQERDIYEDFKNRNIRSSKTYNSKEKIVNEPKTFTFTPSHKHRVMMLLMDKSIAFEVMIYAIVEQHLGILTKSKEVEDALILKTNEGTIKMIVNTLSKHTSSISLTSETDTQYLDKIVHYVKKKEYAFTQY